MPRTPLSLAVILFAVFIAGALAGDYCASSANAARSGAAVAPHTPATSAGDLDWSGRELQELGLKSEAADVARQLADLKTQEDSMILNDRLAFYKKYNLAPESFSSDLKVTDAMADFLKMSDRERKNVEGDLSQIHTQIVNLEKQHLKMAAQTDDSVTYEIEPFAEGSGLKDKLKQLAERDLGTDRANIFLDSATWEMSSSFASFGTGKTSLEVTRIDQGGGNPYRVKETYANGSSMEQTTSNVVPGAFTGLVQLDPTP